MVSRPSLASAQRLVASSLKQGSKPCYARLVVNRKVDFARLSRKLETYGDLPLHVRIRLPIQDESRMTALLRQHVSRFISLDIHVPEQEDAEYIVSSIGDGQPAPLLERLNVSVKQGLQYPIRSFSALKKAFYPSPRLTHLSLPSNPLPDITIPHLLTVTSLTIDSTHLEACWDIYLFDLLDMVESMPHLQHFTFKSFDNFSFVATSNINHPRVISMPNLVSVDVSAPGCGLDILRALDAPLLTTVRFDGYRPPKHQEDFVDALTIPIPASLRRVSERSPKIKSLELRSTVMHYPWEDYSWLLSDEAFPQLEVLRLDATDISDATLLQGMGRMRNLKRLELFNCEHVSGAAIIRFVYWNLLKGRDKNFVVVIDACPSITQEDIVSLSKIAIVESKQ